MRGINGGVHAHAAKFFHGTLPLSSHGHSPCELICRGTTREEHARCSTPKQAPVRTDLTPRDKNDCLAVAQTLNVQVKRLAQQTKRAIPLEFTRVASDLNQSCGAEDFNKAWISIEWMNGCIDNFTKDAELGFCSTNWLLVRTQSTIRRLSAGTITPSCPNPKEYELQRQTR